MSKKSDQLLEAAMGARRPAATIAADMASTVLGMEAQAMKNATPLPMAELVSSPYLSRLLQDADVDHLVASIEAEGLLTPILVRPVERDGRRRYEIIAGHHRVAAFLRLGRTEIPALVRSMSDAEAARALASENTARFKMSDYQLYQYMRMLRSVGQVKSNADMARLLNFSRTKVVLLESFGQLPGQAWELLEQYPDLLGYNVVHQLVVGGLCTEHAALVVKGIERVAAEKMKQGALVEWVKRQAAGRQDEPRREVKLGQGALELRLATTRGGLSLTSSVPLDFDKVKALIEQHLDQLVAG